MANHPGHRDHPIDHAALTSRQELQMAQKEAALDQKTKPSSWDKGAGKGKGKSKNNEKGKDNQQRGKGKPRDEGKKNS